MLNPVLFPELAGRIQREFSGRAPGHCLRIDHLSRVDALRLVAELERVPTDFDCFVLALSPEHPMEIRPDQAIELRNRKDTGICLVVPDELGQDAASSLSNSFALLDLQGFLSEFRTRCFKQLPEVIQPTVRSVLSHLRGRAVVSVEDQIAFFIEIGVRPEAAFVGRAMWMVGLIPDFGEDFAVRLARNRKAVDAISRPARPQSSVEERLRTLRLTSPVFERSLSRYLASRTMHQPEHWQRPIGDELDCEPFSFDKWPFPDSADSSLTEINVDPFVDKHGSVQAYCKLKQDQPGMALIGEVGPKHKLIVRWTSEPAVPLGASKWRADLIPSRSEYGEDLAAVLVSSSIKLSRKQAALMLDVDLEETEYRAVQVRICALDEIGAEIVNADGRPVFGYSEDFWLGQPEDLEEPDRPRKRTDVSLPLARLRVAIEAPIGTTSIEESSAQLSDNSKEEARYFSLQLGGKTIVRLAISRVLGEIHDRCLENPRLAWFTANAESDQQLKVDNVQTDPLPGEFIRGAWDDFFRQRDALMRELRRRAVRSRIEALEIDSTIRDRARKYARAFRDLIDDIQGRNAVDELHWALRTDTLQVEIQYAGDHRQRATVVLPTHPLRLLWYVSYADLLEHFISELLKTPKRERAARLELAAVEKLGPVNLPMFVPYEDGLHCFTHNLGLFAGVLLPPNVQEPARTLSDLATILGMVRDFGPGHDFPIDKLARELQEYCALHAYSGSLRISVSNPGDGAVISVALQRLYEGLGAANESSDLPRLDVLAHCSNPLPIDLPILDRLRERLYVSSTRTGSHLNPVVQIAIRELAQMDAPTGGDVNLAILFDHRAPEILLGKPITGQDSASAYGLLHRIATEFSSNGDQARWLHQITYDPDTAHEKHPVAGAYTSEIIETHDRMLRGATSVEGTSTGTDTTKRVSLVLTLDERTRAGLDRIHHKADWVILIDRYLGIDLFDDPADPFLSVVSRKYLLDYAPEFIDGLGHRLVVTTMWREEVEDILSRAMDDLGFSAIEESVGEALQQLKSVSGRLALRLIRDNSRAKEAASLGVVMAWLRAAGELTNSILVPVDAHPEIFSAGEACDPRKGETGVLSRCDLLQVRFGGRKKVEASFIEVKSRQNQVNYTSLADRMCDQMESTENQFRSLFFQPEKRIDHVLQRSKLAGILRFYALRGRRYGFIEDDGALKDILQAIDGLESGYPHLRTSRVGFIVDLAGKKQKPFSHRGASIRLLTAAEFSGNTPFKVNGPLPGVEVEVVDASTLSKSNGNGHHPSENSEAVLEGAAMGDPAGPKEISVGLGQSRLENEVSWRASVKGSPHLFILGIPGQGKSWITTRLLLEMQKQQLPGVILDFHGQFSSPGSIYVDRVGPMIWDAAKGLPFSPFETTSGSDDWKANCFAVAEIFQYVFQLGDIQRGVIYDAMRDCYLESGANVDATAALPRLSHLEQKIRHYENQTGARNTLVRCKPIFEFNMFDEEGAAVAKTDLLEASRNGLVVDLHKVAMETTQMAAGAFLLRKIYKDMFHWGESDHLRLAIVLDEAHRICKDTTLPKIMKEGRKFGVAVIAATQQLDDFHPDVLGNAGTKIVFRTNHPASRKVAGFLRVPKGFDIIDAVEQLAVGTAMVQTPDMREAELVQLYPIESKDPL